MWRAIAGFALLAACNGAQVGHAIVDAGPGGTANGDSSSGGAIDAPSSGAADASIDAAPLCSSGRVVYLNFDGVTLTQALTSDATQNQAAWMTIATANVPPYHQSSTNRNGQISNIVSGVKAELAAFPISVVTTRPANGPYVMIVFGGTASQVGSRYSNGTSFHDCGDTVKSDVGWVSDNASNSLVVPIVIGSIGWGMGLQGTSDPADCMCGWDNSCSKSSSTCTLSASIASTDSNTTDPTCPGMNPQNEQAAFAAFCQ